MKCIVIGLGNFGLALSQRLTALGHEVIGVDADLAKVNLYKDSISTTIALDVRNEQALASLPLKNVDVVFVLLGKDFGTSLYVIALLKQLEVHRIVARSMSTIHKVILKSMGVAEVIDPEWGYADFLAMKVDLATTIDSYAVDQEHVIMEWGVPASFVGRKLEDIKFKENFGLQLIALKRVPASGDEPVVVSELSATVLMQGDVLVLFGLYSGFRKLRSHLV